MPQIVSIRLCLASLFTLLLTCGLQGQTQRLLLPMPPHIGHPEHATSATVVKQAHPHFSPPTSIQRSPMTHPNAFPSTVSPIAFHIAPYAEDGTIVNYSYGESEYGAYVAVEGDFDHKDGLDVVTIQSDGTLNFMRNDGKGNFTNAFNLPATDSTFANVPQGFAADVNGDGFLDVIASSYYPTNQLMVWINNGDGTFATPVTYALPVVSDPGFYFLGGIAVGDVNGDGKVDIVILAYVETPGGDPVSPLYAFTFAGKGDGTFPAGAVITNRTQLATPNGSLEFGTAALADMNGDGKLDLVAAIANTNNAGSYVNEEYIGISLGDGTGHFANFPADLANVEVVANTSFSQQIQVLDLNNDAKSDVLWSDSVNTIYTSIGRGDGTLLPPTIATYSDDGATSLTVGDYNRDGYFDVAVFNTAATAIYAGNGDGTFAALPLAQYPNELVGEEPPVAQDFDGDGIVDLIGVRSFFNQLAFLKGNGNGTFQSESPILPSNSASGGPSSSEPAENITVLATGKWAGGNDSGVLAEEDINGTFFLDLGIADGHGGLAFTRSLNQAQVAAHDLQFAEPIAADFNGDGLQDVVWITSTGVAIGLSKGDGTYSSIVATDFPSLLPCSLGFADAGDLNGDGQTDLVVTYVGDLSCTETPIVPSGFFILLGDGSGHFKVTFQAAGDNLYRIKIASLKNDGVMDLILDDASYSTPRILSLSPSSPGVYSENPTTLWAPGSQLADVAVQDINGDGIPDLTLLQVGLQTTDSSQPGILTLLGSGDGTFQTPQFAYAGNTGVSLQYADFNQDGLSDLAVDLGSNGQFGFNGVAVFPNLGRGLFGKPILLPAPLNRDSSGHILVNNQIFTGDFNADGAPDILLAGGAGFVPGVLYLNQAGSSLQLVAGAMSIFQHSPVTFTVLIGAVGSTLPSGSISFYVNGASLGSAAIINGSASLSSNALPIGTDSIIAKFDGSFTNYPATSNTAVVTVTAIPSDFTMGSAASTLSVTSTVPAATMISLTSNSSFTGSVTLICEGLPPGASCSFTPASVPLTPANTASVKLVVSYSNRSASAVAHTTEVGTSLCAVFFLLWPVPAKRRRRLSLAIALLIVGSSIGGLCGCSSPATNTHVTSNITIVATGVAGSVTLNHSVLLQIAFQQ